MRIAFAVLLVASSLALDVRPAPGADLAIKLRVHRHHALSRPWCVIQNLGKGVWTCAPTLAQCHAFEIPGTTLYCVRDPIPGRPYAMRW